MIEKETGLELSYWEQNPQLKSQMHNIITMAYQTNNKILGKINSAFGEYPLVRIEMADRRGIFKEMPARYINIIMDMYFFQTRVTLQDIAIKNGLNHKSRVSQINNVIINRLAIVRNRNLKYLDTELQPLYQEEAQYEENRQKMEAQKKEAVQKRNKERREKDQQLIALLGKGLTYKQISAIMGSSVPTLHERSVVLRQRGVEVPIHRKKPRSKEELTMFDNNVKDLYDVGLSYEKIAQKLSVESPWISSSTRRLAKAGKIQRRNPRG